MFAPRHLRQLLTPFWSAPRWWLGLSGGVDSLLLLHLLAPLAGRPPLHAVHVHHGLYPQADDWVEHCRRACGELGVELTVSRVAVARGGDGEEAEARRARYDAFARLLGPGEVLLLGHHLDDQLETLLMRLLRGAGVDGLAGMPRQRPLGAGRLFRPLLDCRRVQILAEAERLGLHWIDDPSNRDPRLERGFLRQQLLPRLAERWPDYDRRLERSLAHLGQAREVLDDQAASDLSRCDYRPADHSLALPPLAALSRARQHNLLRYWLRQLALPPPPARAWVQWTELLNAGADAAPRWHWEGAELRRHRQRLYPLQALPEPADSPGVWHPPEPWRAPGMGKLTAVATRGSGLRLPVGATCVIRRRRGGERCRPQGRRHSQTLKRLLQEHGLPPWWRQRLPLVYVAGELAAVGDLWVCEGHAAGPGEAGWLLSWQRPGVPVGRGLR